MTDHEERPPPPALVAEVRARVGALSEERRAAGWRRLRAPGDRASTRGWRRLAVMGLVLAPALAIAVFVLRRPENSANRARLHLENATLVDGELRPRRAGQGFLAVLASGARLRFDPGATGRLSAVPDGTNRVAVEGTVEVEIADGVSRGLAAGPFELEAGPFVVAATGARFRVSWAPSAARFGLVMNRGHVRVTGPLLGGRKLTDGQTLAVDLPAYRVDFQRGSPALGEHERVPGERRRGSGPIASGSREEVHTPTPVALLAEAAVTIEWDAPTGRRASPLHFGLNINRGLDPERSGHREGFERALGMLRPGLARLYRGELMQDARRKEAAWILDPDGAAPRWDREKIGRALAGMGGAVRLLTIPGWPSGLGPADRPLDRGAYAAFAELCADLVRVVNLEHRQGVRYFEIFNEIDGVYRGRGAELGLLFREVARAMKAVDPTIRVGGPGFVQPWHEVVDPFLRTAGDSLDFVSYHLYGTGNPDASVDEVLDAAMGFEPVANHMERVVARHVGRPLELFHDQYSLTWRAPDPRLVGGLAAVFDALALRAFALSPLTGAAAWCDSDGWSGKLDGSYKARPAAHVFRLYNAHLTGAVVAAASSVEGVVPLAVANGARRAVSLVNRTEAPVRARLHMTGDPVITAAWEVHHIDETGHAEATIAPEQVGDRGLLLPPLSVTVLVAPGR